MSELQALFQGIIEGRSLIRGIFSSPRHKAAACRKVILRPVHIKGQLMYQAEYHEKTKVLHRNMNGSEALSAMRDLIEQEFKQADLYTSAADFQILAAKPDHPRILEKPPSRNAPPLTHDQEKNHRIPEGTPCDFLIRLGVMNDAGQVLRKHYAKFRQINRFLEIVDDVASALPAGRELSIVDFGCGKAYLTFALYYYLKLQKGIAVRMTGLDLKEDVIDFCNGVARELGYDGLRFELGDIAQYASADNAFDMVVTLHACDTATDQALIKAVGWDASIILSVPCCQHELFDQIDNPVLAPMLKHGILKERTSAIVTDALRALKLKECGYDVTLIEFTSLEHTAKNIMIRAIRTGRADPKAAAEFDAMVDFWHVSPAIASLRRPASRPGRRDR